MENLIQLFYDEAYEMLDHMEQLLLSLESQSPDPEVVNALFRYAHSFKGNSAAMGFTHLSRFTHGLESAMESLRREQRPLTPQVTTLLLQAVDVIRAMLERTRTEGDVEEPACGSLLQQLQVALSGPPASTPLPDAADKPDRPDKSDHPDESDPSDKSEQAVPEAPSGSHRYRLIYQPAPTLSAEHDPLQLLRELEEYSTIIEARFQHQIPPLNALKPDACYGHWELVVETGFEPAILRAVLELSAEGASVQIDMSDPSAMSDESDRLDRAEAPQPIVRSEQPAPSVVAVGLPAKTESQSVRVATEKVDALFNLVSEIVIAQSMLSSAQSATSDEHLRAAITQMERHVRELHERVMAIRLLPIGHLFNRFPRMVRDTAAQLGKKVNLVIEGEETELDRTLLEALSDPLTHLVRNAIDHGIEPPEERRANGKPETGTVTLSAYQAEGRIYIVVSDDGRGIDIERVRQKAIQLGWLSENDQPSPETLYEFLFRPGFSTAQQVSDLSGRGVGMDVVKRNVESLGGTIQVHAEAGKGTRFTLKVPLTLAIMDGLGLRVGEEQYIVPLTAVVEAFRLSDLQYSALFEQQEVVNVRGRFIPLIRLRQFVGLPDITTSSQGVGADLRVCPPTENPANGSAGLSPSNKPNLQMEGEPPSEPKNYLQMEGEPPSEPKNYLSTARQEPRPSTKSSNELVLVLEQEGQQLALAIDGIVGQQQVVLKSLEENFTRIPGFAGATILGDGQVALILDVAYLIQRACNARERAYAA
ncbi:Chemotaxis protein CheA [bacterium HR15]|nr:Chemotaxis protein CheA [bacterium HR15]